MGVQEFMQKSGIPNKLKGYEFIKCAIQIKLNDPNLNMSQIKEKVGAEYGCCNGTVENTMKWAIQHRFEHMDVRLRNTLFDYCKDVAPTTKEYIEGVAYAIRNNII